ncbi:MAG: hypothetical protein ABSH16_03785 [Sedimentisphaerales bacterium]
MSAYSEIYIRKVQVSAATELYISAVPKHPAYYGSCLEAFNTPELATGPIAITGERLLGIVRGCDAISVKLPITTATPKAETKQIKDEKPWHE